MLGTIIRTVIAAAALHLVVSAGAARAQTPPSDALDAAKELIETMHLNDQYKAILPTIFKTMKPGIVQGRAEVDREYDALLPMMMDAFQARVAEITNAAAIVYARNFSTEDLRALNAFYKSPAGQRMLQKMPAVTQELMMAGTKFGQSVAGDLKQRMVDELRKKGVNL